MSVDTRDAPLLHMTQAAAGVTESTVLSAIGHSPLMRLATIPRDLSGVEIYAKAEWLNPEDEVVVYCHVGQRSAAVAEYLAQLGFKNAKNLLGGLDYWAQSVDPAMPRY